MSLARTGSSTVYVTDSRPICALGSWSAAWACSCSGKSTPPDINRLCEHPALRNDAANVGHVTDWSRVSKIVLFDPDPKVNRYPHVYNYWMLSTFLLRLSTSKGWRVKNGPKDQRKPSRHVDYCQRKWWTVVSTTSTSGRLRYNLKKNNVKGNGSEAESSRTETGRVGRITVTREYVQIFPRSFF